MNRSSNGPQFHAARPDSLGLTPNRVRTRNLSVLGGVEDCLHRSSIDRSRARRDLVTESVVQDPVRLTANAKLAPGIKASDPDKRDGAIGKTDACHKVIGEFQAVLGT